MIIPRSKLLFWVTAVILPAALLAAVAPQTAQICILIAVGFAAVVAADALRARRSLAGIAVELPRVVRMSKQRQTILETVELEPRLKRLIHFLMAEVQKPRKDKLV